MFYVTQGVIQARRARERRYEARRLANAKRSGLGAKECARRRAQIELRPKQPNN